ncbi:MAG: hydroxylamine reductase [bacterium]
MFCCQCEETVNNYACELKGVCGKDPETAGLQDGLIQSGKILSLYAHHLRKRGVVEPEVDRFILDALFTTVTNVNFDPAAIRDLIEHSISLRNRIYRQYFQIAEHGNVVPESFLSSNETELVDAERYLQDDGYQNRMERSARWGEDIASLQEILLQGLKGAAAYAHHALVLGYESDEIYAGFHEGLAVLCDASPTMDKMISACMKCGELNLKVMELLDSANTGTYGHPEPTEVRVTPVRGKCILVSGHDLKYLEELLKQTDGLGINIYTHGEMLPAHSYPELKKFGHLVGNYGGAWQDQQTEFDAFPGAILMTTNCIQRPRVSYRRRIFSSGLVAYPGVTHIEGFDFAPVIEAALDARGFTEEIPEQKIMIGFGHHAVLSVADQIVEAVKGGALKHFFLIGGCDGHKSTRSYYTELAQQVPQDCVVLTLACGKYRFNRLEFGDIGGIPRLLDMGQCNDAFSAIRVAVELSKAFECDVNDLPLSLVLSWYEQKAVAILLTLLYLGIRDIRIGPDLPAFISPGVLKFLQENFKLMPVTTPEADLKAILN